MCGGTWGGKRFAMLPFGLSPRVRGNPMTVTPWNRPPGSIPACAGEPREKSKTSTPSGVYPRVCGGTDRFFTLVIVSHGLSPRVRGNPLLLTDMAPHIGSIPACAGEPTSNRTSLTPLAVYPRVCGGTQMSSMPTDSPAGLSPRVRGNRWAATNARTQTRSIPACAGEPLPLPLR